MRREIVHISKSNAFFSCNPLQGGKMIQYPDGRCNDALRFKRIQEALFCSVVKMGDNKAKLLTVRASALGH